MKTSPKILLKGSFLVFGILTVTACPSPAKIDKAIQLSKEIQLNDKYEKLFNDCINEQESDLLFSHVVKSPGPTIHLLLKSRVTNTDWFEELRAFQTKLKRTNTQYSSVVINDYGNQYSYTPKSLAFCEETYLLFEKNLQQIKENNIEELYKTMTETKQGLKEINGLIDYLQIKNFDKTRLACYPSDEKYQKMAFCLDLGGNNTLYFSYVPVKSGISLFRIDFNSFSSLPNGDIPGQRSY